MSRKPTIILFPLAVLLLLASTQLPAQMVDCTVNVNYEAVSTTHKDLLRDFASDVGEYVNNYQWGADNIPERVKCTLDIFVQRASGENRYLAQVFVGSQRPIYGSNKSSVVLRLMDEAWEFTYIKGRPINHNLYAYGDLTSFLDFYMLLVVAYDNDTFEKMAGTPIFQKAADIANLGRSSGEGGWQLAKSGYSRLQLINELLAPGYRPVRAAYWTYHFTGLDSLAFAPEKAYANIVEAIEAIGRVKHISDPRNQAIKVFFDTKYMELADLFVEHPDKSIYARLGAIDPAHVQTYEEYRLRQ